MGPESPGFCGWNCFIRASFAAQSQRPSNRFDGPGFPGDLDHRRRNRKARSTPHSDFRGSASIGTFARPRVSKLPEPSLFQCRASAELWTTNRPDARLARSRTKNIRKESFVATNGRGGGVAVSEASARVSGLSHQRTGAGEFRKFNANADRRVHDRRCNPAVDSDKLARQPSYAAQKALHIWNLDGSTLTLLPLVSYSY